MNNNEPNIIPFPVPVEPEPVPDEPDLDDTASDVWFDYAQTVKERKGQDLLDVLYEFSEFGEDPETVLLNWIDVNDLTVAFRALHQIEHRRPRPPA